MKKLIQKIKKWSVATKLFGPLIVGMILLYIMPEWLGWIVAGVIAVIAILFLFKETKDRNDHDNKGKTPGHTLGS